MYPISDDSAFFRPFSIQQSLRHHKIITDSEDYVPLFWCVPTARQMFGLIETDRSIFPHCWALAEKYGTQSYFFKVILSKVISWMGTAYLSYGHVTNHEQVIGYHSTPEIKTLLTSKIVAYKEKNYNDKLFSDIYTSVIAGLASTFPPHLFADGQGRNSTLRNLPLCYFLRPIFDDLVNDNPITRSLVMNYSRAFCEDRGKCWLTRYGYIGYSDRANSLGDSNGLISVCCVMVKVEKQLEIFAALLSNNFSLLELEKGDIQLWQRKDLDKIFAIDQLGDYHQCYYREFRNELKAPVREFDNLDYALFDIDRPVNLSPPELRKYKEKELTKVVAKMFTYHTGVRQHPSRVLYNPI